MRSISRIIKYLIPYKGEASLSILFALLSAIFSLVSLAMVVPFSQILFGITDLVNEKVEITFSTDMVKAIITDFNYSLSQIIIIYGKVRALIFIGVLVIVATFLRNAFLYLSKYFLVPVRTGILRDLRNTIFGKVLDLPLAYFTEERKGDIMARMAQDVQEIEISVIRSLEMIFQDPIRIIIYMAGLMIASIKLTLFVLVLLPLSGYFIGSIGKTLRSTSLEGQKKLGLIMSVFEETIAGLRIVKAFNAEEKMKNRFENTNKLYTRLIQKIYLRQQLASPLSEFLGVLIVVIVLWYGGLMVLGANSTLTAPVLITFLVIFSQIINPAKAVTTAYYSILKGLASADRIDYILNAEISIRETENPVEIKEFRNSIEYKNVSFKYEKEFVLKNAELKIEKGRAIALVGRSGSGKSTFVDLLPRFIDATEGQVLIDGIDIREFRVHDLRKLMGIVSQQSILFNDSFFNNIAFGMYNVSEEQVIAAAKVANAHDFIMETANGYYTNVGDAGSKLSGGQKQRISIARAVLKNPPILILDEATSSLDTESELLVQEAITNLMKNRTSIVIAHRLSTVKHSDLIIVIDEGKIVEIGKHNELMHIKNGTYKNLHNLQMY